jgi:hypothetical protein
LVAGEVDGGGEQASLHALAAEVPADEGADD